MINGVFNLSIIFSGYKGLLFSTSLVASVTSDSVSYLGVPGSMTFLSLSLCPSLTIFYLLASYATSSGRMTSLIYFSTCAQTRFFKLLTYFIVLLPFELFYLVFTIIVQNAQGKNEDGGLVHHLHNHLYESMSSINTSMFNTMFNFFLLTKIEVPIIR